MATSATTELRFRLLGPLEILKGGESLHLGGERQRGLLALLLLHANELVTTERLVEQLFGADASDSSVRAVRVAVSRLRRLLDDETLVTRPGGYVVYADPSQLDVAEFEALVMEGRRALELRDPTTAASSFRAALGLFRGPPLADLAMLDFMQPEIRRLEELRLSALMDRTDADLALGRGAELVPELEGLVQANPFQERLRGQLMLALYRSGRQTDALEVYRRTRELLADELGLEPSRALQQLERSMLRHDPALDVPAQARVLGPAVCPFKGLAAFEAADAFYFCGRERLLSELVARLASGTFVGIVGPSGVGKSSLLRAGVLPALRGGALPGSANWRVALLRPGDRSIAEALESGDRVVIAIDQLEEIFADDVPAAERTAFLDELERAAADPSRRALVLVTLRADFYGCFAEYPRLADRLSQSHVFVRSLDRDELARAIEVPAGRAGLEVERGLVDALVADTAGAPGALPLLQTTLLQLWSARDGRALRFDAYRAIGGVRGAVARLAEETFTRLSPGSQERARQMMLRLAGGDEGALVRRRVPLADVLRFDGMQPVLDALVTARLLTVDDGLVEISHEALLHEWPRYRGWLEDDRVGRRAHAHLTASADDWAARGHDAADLYRGARLSAALELPVTELTGPEREFLEASRAEADRELRRQRSHNRRLRASLAGAFVLLAAAVVAGAVALHKSHTAAAEARAALAGQLGAEAEVEPRIDRAMLLAREALRIDRTNETKGTLLATLLRSPAALATYTLPIDSRPQNIAVDPHGRYFVVTDNTGHLRFYSTRTHRQLRPPLKGFGYVPLAVAFSADGNRFLAADWTGKHGPTYDVLDAATLHVLRRLQLDPWLRTHQPLFAQFGMFTPDGRTVLYVYGDPANAWVDRWDLRTGRLVSRLRVGAGGIEGASLIEHGRVLAVATDRDTYLWQLSPRRLLTAVPAPPGVKDGAAAITSDGRVAAVGTRAGGIVFVDLRTGKQTVGPAGHVGDVQNDATSPDGRLFVTVGDDAKVIVWDTRTFQPIEILTGHGGRITWPAFSADSRTLFTTSLDGSILEWDLGNARRFGRPFRYLHGSIDLGPQAPSAPPLAVSPDNRSIAVDTSSETVGVYALRRLAQVRTLRIAGGATAIGWAPKGDVLALGGRHGAVELVDGGRRALTGLVPRKGTDEAVEAIAFDHRGDLVAASDERYRGNTPSGALALWRVGGRRIATLRLAAPTWSVAFSPDDRLVAVGTDDGKAVLVDTATGAVRRTIRPQGGSVTTVAFAPDGTFGTGTWAGVVQLWNPATGKEIGRPVLAQPSPIASLAFDPRGGTFATTGGSDGTAKLWMTATLRELGSAFQSDPSQWGTARYTPDGRHLVVIYGDGTGYVWPTTVSAWIAHACTVAGRNLTREEWRRYVPHRHYAPVCD
jgi:DNA-binding SARP family transcriptional activator/WD40 repeat protein/energy-coupling factor transporter ATP-binding protein EcfA2